jgi:Ca2+/H+ antiporter, TMEM165/GDT1 family
LFSVFDKKAIRQIPLSIANRKSKIANHFMDWKIFGTAFLTLFLAELGDKTQLAVITMTSGTESKVSVFLGAALALVVVTLLGVVFGGVLSQYIPTEWLQRIVAAAFIVIGVLMLFGKL